MVSNTTNQRRQLEAFAEQAALLMTGVQTDTLPLFLIKTDVYTSLRRVLIASGRPLSTLKDDWKPPASGLDAVSWGSLLSAFAVDLRAHRPDYGPYSHKPRFAATTLEMPLAAIDQYLAKKVCAALGVAWH